jgi:hypothetical protein
MNWQYLPRRQGTFLHVLQPDSKIWLKYEKAVWDKRISNGFFIDFFHAFLHPLKT